MVNKYDWQWRDAVKILYDRWDHKKAEALRKRMEIKWIII